MFDKQFYPTPKDLVLKMIEPYKKTQKHYRYDFDVNSYHFGSTILDPSAGHGNILDVINDVLDSYHDKKLYAIEINPDFQHMLRDKGYKILHDDFLTYSSDILFDFIIMNPPFKDGAKHLLHAWNLLYKGDIVCILNAQTIKNVSNKYKERVVNLIEDYGSVEYIESAFENAERKTSVEVALIRLHKKEPENNMFGFEKSFKTKDEEMPELDSETINNSVITQNIIQNMIIEQEGSKKAFVEFLNAYNKFKFYTEPIMGNYDNMFEFITEVLNKKSNAESYNEFIVGIKRRSWNRILDSKIFDKHMTNKVRQNFNSFVQQQSTMLFNVENILKVIEMLVMNKTTIMEGAITDVFDIFTKYYKENRIDEGWKTNDSWRVNRKIIFPYWIKYGNYSSPEDLKKYGSEFSLDYRDDYNDIDRVMCYLKGYDINSILTIHAALHNHFRELGRIRTGEKFNNKLSSTFFDIKFWKKGTVHLYFKEEKLWQYFNEAAAKGKNWLPPGEEPKNPWKEDIPKENPINEIKQLQQSLF